MLPGGLCVDVSTPPPAPFQLAGDQVTGWSFWPQTGKVWGGRGEGEGFLAPQMLRLPSSFWKRGGLPAGSGNLPEGLPRDHARLPTPAPQRLGVWRGKYRPALRVSPRSQNRDGEVKGTEEDVSAQPQPRASAVFPLPVPSKRGHRELWRRSGSPWKRPLPSLPYSPWEKSTSSPPPA